MEKTLHAFIKKRGLEDGSLAENKKSITDANVLTDSHARDIENIEDSELEEISGLELDRLLSETDEESLNKGENNE